MALRLEAFNGGRGDRFIPGTPVWLAAIPTAAAVYVTALVAFVVTGPGLSFDIGGLAIANSILVAIYLAIGWFVLCTQLRNRGPMRGWSVSGLSLSAVFPTCAVMHGIWVVYDLSGRYRADIHGAVIDTLSIPAGLYFLWVVRGLYRDSLRDWNQFSTQGSAASAPAVTTVASPLPAPAPRSGTPA